MSTNGDAKPKRRKLLTDAEIRRSKPNPKPYAVNDGNNLRVRIMPSGQKYWQVRYKIDGVEKTFQIGVYEEGAQGPKRFGIYAAREARNEVMALVRAGYDPMVVKERQETAEGLQAQQAEDAGEFSVETLTRRWIKRQQWVPSHMERMERLFERDVFPQIGPMHVATITRDVMLRLVLRPIEERGKLRTMHDLRAMLKTLYDTLEIEGYVPDGFQNPATEKLNKVLRPPRKVEHQPAIINIDQLRDFLAKCDALPGQPVTKAANRFIHLTAVRTGTLREAKWSQFKGLHDPEPVWFIPDTQMKTREPFVLPLSRQAAELLLELQKVTGEGSFVFPSVRNDTKPISENDILFLIYRAGGKGIHSGHGARAAFSSIMNKRHTRERHVIDLCLAHSPFEEVEEAYMRDGLVDRRREIMQEYADLLTAGLVPPADLLNGPRH